MKAFFALLKVSFQQLLLSAANIGGRKKGKAVSAVGAFLLLGGLMLFVSGTVSFSLMSEMAPLGAANVVLYFVLILAIFFPIVFTLMGAQGTIFSAKDADLVFSLPVSAFSVMLAKVLALYLEALALVALCMVPAGVAYMLFAGGGVAFLLLFLVSSLFLALVPTIVALIFGFLVSVVVARLPFKKVLTVLFSVLFFVGIMVGSFALSYSMGTQDAASLVQIETGIATALPPLAWVVRASTALSLPSFGLLAVCTLLPFLALVWVFSLFYKGIITRLSSHQLKSNYKLRRLSASGSFGALLRKELARFFGTPLLFLNSGLMPGILIVGSIVAFFQRTAIANFFSSLILQVALASEGADTALLEATVTQWIPLAMLAIFAFFMSTVYLSSVSISLEGKNLWILKSAPLSAWRIFLAKGTANFVIEAATVLIAVPLLGLSVGMSVVDIVCCVVLLLLFGALFSLAGVFLNLLFPRLDYINENQVIKNSAAVFISMLFGVVVALLIAGVYYLCSLASLSFAAFSLVGAAILAGLLALCCVVLRTRGRKIFESL